ncbi:MAG: lipid carrier : UDP-N-acetylgalactosaminyltransferase, partial [Segetibacter sp.]|nr:lipid carrier : UDP-N-acetylgalactosaminyltransferase [Segetibacter sp.]
VIFRDEETLVSKSTDFKELYRRINSDKGQLELWYQENMSIKTDFLIVFLTAYSIFFPKQTLTYKVFKNLPQLEEIGEMEAVSSVTQVQRKVQQKNQVEKTENLSYK